MKTKKLIASLVISISMAGSAVAENLSTVHGIPAEAMSHEDMNSVEGKFYSFSPVYGYFFVNEFNGDIYKNQGGRFSPIPIANFNNISKVEKYALIKGGQLTSQAKDYLIRSYGLQSYASLPNGPCYSYSCAVNTTNTVIQSQNITDPFFGINPNILGGLQNLKLFGGG